MPRVELIAAAAILTVGTAALPPSPAAAPVIPDAVRPALERLEPVETVACYGFGWRGWGIYPGWYPACTRVVPIYAAPGYAAAVPVAPTPGRCWVATTPDGRTGYWHAC